MIRQHHLASGPLLIGLLAMAPQSKAQPLTGIWRGNLGGLDTILEFRPNGSETVRLPTIGVVLHSTYRVQGNVLQRTTMSITEDGRTVVLPPTRRATDTYNVTVHDNTLILKWGAGEMQSAKLKRQTFSLTGLT